MKWLENRALALIVRLAAPHAQRLLVVLLVAALSAAGLLYHPELRAAVCSGSSLKGPPPEVWAAEP